MIRNDPRPRELIVSCPTRLLTDAAVEFTFTDVSSSNLTRLRNTKPVTAAIRGETPDDRHRAARASGAATRTAHQDRATGCCGRCSRPPLARPARRCAAWCRTRPATGRGLAGSMGPSGPIGGSIDDPFDLLPVLGDAGEQELREVHGAHRLALSLAGCRAATRRSISAD